MRVTIERKVVGRGGLWGSWVNLNKKINDRIYEQAKDIPAYKGLASWNVKQAAKNQKKFRSAVVELVVLFSEEEKEIIKQSGFANQYFPVHPDGITNLNVDPPAIYGRDLLPGRPIQIKVVKQDEPTFRAVENALEEECRNIKRVIDEFKQHPTGKRTLDL